MQMIFLGLHGMPFVQGRMHQMPGMPRMGESEHMHPDAQVVLWVQFIFLLMLSAY